jgi:hypothetical protein
MLPADVSIVDQVVDIVSNDATAPALIVLVHLYSMVPGKLLWR